ncbi:presqualene diphosphate synthase HpnD [Pseudonocardia acaciae]|uniref:presqualene diphosphate synthase HpnD n=1 Tax=Pseudonocardia acaciae TaxID=551276 RepID=UPI00048C42B1|nr:presqualene diphosphate synthase HpnD [Pseudonocardia acaciae]
MTEVAQGTVGDAYRLCETITRTEARNFYYGIRLLRPGRRAAMCAIYALARRVDDIGDDVDGASPAERLDALDAVHRSLADIAHSSDPVLVAVADAARRLPIPLAAFEELIEGVRMDVTGRRYVHFDELVEYCRCVAGSIGRLCLSVFDHQPDPRAPLYADHLGIALQQTNILRDIREDLTNGRIYLPAEDLDRFGVTLALDEHTALADPDGGLAKLIGDAATRARQWYGDGLRLLPLLDRRSAACCGAMSGIYHRLLDRIAEHPERVYDRRLSLSGREKAAVAARALLGRTP